MTTSCDRTFTSVFQGTLQGKRWWEILTQQLNVFSSQHRRDSTLQRDPGEFFQKIRLKRKLLIETAPRQTFMPIQKRPFHQGKRIPQNRKIETRPSILNYEILPAHHHLMGAWSISEEPSA